MRIRHDTCQTSPVCDPLGRRESGLNRIAAVESSPIVLIVASAVASGLKTEADLPKDILLFAGTDLVHAFQAITNHHPSVVVLQRDLLAPRRAVELIGRIRTDPDPTVSQVQIRVISDVNAYVQLVSRRTHGGRDTTIAAPGDPLPAEYDSRQWARRFRTRPGVEVQVDRIAAKLTDLSHSGAQLVAPTLLRPHQHVRILTLLRWVGKNSSRAPGSETLNPCSKYPPAEPGALVCEPLKAA